MKTIVLIIFLAFIFLFVDQAHGQHKRTIEFNQGKHFTLYSKILKEDRKIRIYTPVDTLHPDRSYPVLYVLDPENHFNLLVEYSKLLSRQDFDAAPPLILVGIENTNRSRDLTPTKSNIDYGGEVGARNNICICFDSRPT